MRNAGLDEPQAGIKISGRNINNLRYADDNTLMAESEEELKSFLMKVKEESEKVGLKLNIWKTQQWSQIGKGQFLFQSQRRSMPKNDQTSSQLHSFHILERSCPKSFKLVFNST